MALLKYIREKNGGLPNIDSFALAKAVYDANPKYQTMSFDNFASAAGIEEDIAATRSGLKDTAAAVIESVPVAGMGLLSSAVGAIKGVSKNAGVYAEDLTMAERLQSKSDKMTAEYLQKHGINTGDKFLGLTPAGVAQAMSNMGYTGLGMVSGGAGGAAGLAATGGNPVGGYVGAGVASAGVLTSAAKNQIMRAYRDALNEKREEAGEPILSDKEWFETAAAFNKEANKHALWESGLETAGELLEFGAITAPLKKIVGKEIAERMAKNWIGKTANVGVRSAAASGSELATEAVTLLKQAPIEKKAGLREDVPENFLEAVKEVYPVVMPMAIIAGGGAKLGHVAYKKASERIKEAKEKRANTAVEQAKKLAESLIGKEPSDTGLRDRDLAIIAEEILNDIETGLYDNPAVANDLAGEVERTPGLLDAIEKAKNVRVGVIPTPATPSPSLSETNLGPDFKNAPVNRSALDAEDSEKNRIRQVYALKQQIAAVKQQAPGETQTPFRARVIKKLEADLEALGPVNLSAEAAKRNQVVLSGMKPEIAGFNVPKTKEDVLAEQALAGAEETAWADEQKTIQKQRNDQQVISLRKRLADLKKQKQTKPVKKQIKETEDRLGSLKPADIIRQKARENQARIDAGLFPEEFPEPRTFENAPVNRLAGKAKTLADMSASLQTTETRGVATDKEGNRYSFGASSPRWFTKLNEKTKSVGQEFFSRKEIDVLARKYVSRAKLTAKQRQRMFLLDQAVTDFENETGKEKKGTVTPSPETPQTISSEPLAAPQSDVTNTLTPTDNKLLPVAEAKSVPAEVLKDYPDLAAKTKPAAWESSELVQSPNIQIDRTEAKKQADGSFRLFFRGTRNEVFAGQTFGSASEARQFFKVQQAKAQQDAASSRKEPDDSPKFSLTEDKSLYITHNITEDKLRHALDLGGLAMPSSAVSSIKNEAMVKFGDISLLAHPNFLQSGKVRVFDADIYSPRYPAAKYDINEKAITDFNKWIDGDWNPFVSTQNKWSGHLDGSDIQGHGLDAILNKNSVKYAWLRDNGIAPKITKNTESPYKSLSQAFRSHKTENAFRTFVREKFKTLVTGRKILKGVTSLGNRRYIPYTLDNIIKQMRSGALRSGEASFYGVGSIRASHAKEYKSLGSIKKDKDRLVNSEQMNKIKNDLQNQLSDLLESLKPFYKFESTSFGYYDDAGRALAEGRHGINETFKELPKEALDKIDAFLKSLKEAPTEYFEAKAQRIVGFNEFHTAVVPKNTSPDVVAALKKHGLAINYYKNGDNADRQRAIRKADKVLFQKTTSLGSGFPIAEVKAIVLPLLNKLTAGPKAHFVQSEAELPPRIIDIIQRKNASGQIVAVNDRGDIYFVADNIRSTEDAESAFLHEVFGHYGVEAILGKEKAKRFFTSVWMSKLNDPEFMKIATTYDSDLSTVAGKVEAAREYVAKLAESGVDNSLITKLIGMIRGALRKLGVKMKISNNDIRQLIALGARQMKGVRSKLLVAEKTVNFQIAEMVKHVLGIKLDPAQPSDDVFFMRTPAPTPAPMIDNFKALKKAFGETTARVIRGKMPIAYDHSEELIAFLQKKVPVKSHLPYIITNMGMELEVEFLSEKMIIVAPVKEKLTLSAKELAEKAGYRLTETKTRKDVLSFRSDYSRNSVICTYNDIEGRLRDRFIFWLRRYNADVTPRAEELTQDNLTPEWKKYLEKRGWLKDDGTYALSGLKREREDPYGTSSMCVQIWRKNDKSKGSLWILNRYNHTLQDGKNPDVTYNRKLNKIIDGLEDAIYDYVKIKKPATTTDTPVLSPGIVEDAQGSLYHYARERNGVYWGDGFIMSGGAATIVNPGIERVVEGFVLRADGIVNGVGLFANYENSIFSLIGKTRFGKKGLIECTTKDNKKFSFFVQNGQIIRFDTGDLTEISGYSLCDNAALTSIALPNVTTIGAFSLSYNSALTSIALPNVETIGNSSLRDNAALASIELPNVKIIDNYSLSGNAALTSIELPNVTAIGNYSLRDNAALASIALPNVETIGNNSLSNNPALASIELPNVKIIDNYSLSGNAALASIALPNVTTIGNYSLSNNDSLTSIALPNVTTIGNYSLRGNAALTSIALPNVITIGNHSLRSNAALTSIALPNVITIGNHSLCNNAALALIELPNVTTIGDLSLIDNAALASIALPNVETIGNDSLNNNPALASIELPNVTTIGNYSLSDNAALASIELPNVKIISSYSLCNNAALASIELPNVKIISSYSLCNNAALTSIALPNVITIDNYSLRDNAALASIALPNVTTISNSSLSSNPALTSITLPNVETIGKNSLRNNAALASIALPNVTTIGNFSLSDNAALASIELPNVTTISDYSLSNNAALKNIILPFGKKIVRNNKTFTGVRAEDQDKPLFQTVKAGVSNFSGVTTKQIRSFFKGLDSGRSPDGKVWVRIGKRIVIVEQVEGLINKRQFVATLSIRDPGKAFGAYKNKTIYLSSLGDKYTLAHEGIHLLDDIGLINRLEQTVIEKAAGVERGASVGDRAEARAEYLTALLEAREKTRNTVLGRIVQKVRDFIDGLRALFGATVGQVAKGIETGQAFQREAGKGESGAGKIIPLLERFNDQSDDIRFQTVGPADALGTADTIDKKAAEKTRKAVDAIIADIKKTTKKNTITVSETKARKLASDYVFLKTMMKDNSVDLEQKIKEYKAFLMKLPPGVRAKALAGMPKIVTAKTKKTRQKYFDQVIVQAQKFLSEEVKKELRRDIHKLRRKPRTAKGGKVKKNVLSQLEKLNKTVFGKTPINTMPAAEFHINALSKQRETLEENVPDSDNKIATNKWFSDIEDIDQKIALINTFGGIKEMSEAQLVNAYEELQRIIAEGRTKWQVSEAIRKQKMEEIRGRLDREITGEKAPKPETIGQRNQRIRDQQKAWNRIADKLSQFDTIHQSWRFLMDKLARKSGKGTLKSDAVEIIGGAAHYATNEENALNGAAIAMITKKVKDLIGGTGHKVKRWVDNQSNKEDLYILTYENGKNEQIKLTPMTAAYWWAVKQRGDALAEDGMAMVNTTFQKMGADAAFFGQIKKTIDPAVIELSRWLSETLGEHIYQTVSPVYKQRFGAVLDHGRAYTPIQRQIFRKERDVNLLQQYQETPSIIKGALHTLTHSTKSIRETNLLKVWMDHIYDMNHFAAWSIPIQMMQSVFGNPITKGYIERIHGTNMNFAIDEFIKKFTAGRRKLKDVFNVLNLDSWRGRFSSAVIGANPVIYIKQLTSIPAMAADIPTNDFIAGFADFLNPTTGSPLEKMRILGKSQFVKMRYEKGHTRDVAIASRKTLGQTIGQQHNWPTKLMFLARLGDMQAIYAGGWAVYKYHLEAGLKNGLGEPEAKKRAIIKFEEVARDTQQSGEIMDLGLVQQGGDFSKLMTMFFTAPASYYREISAAIRNMPANPGNSAKRLFLFWVIVPAMFEAIASLPLVFDDDDDDFTLFWKRMFRSVVLGPTNGLFLVRDIAETLYNILFLKNDSGWGDAQYSPVGSVSDTTNRIAKDLREIVEGDDDDFEKLLKDAVDIAGYVSGYPLPAASNLIENWVDVAAGDTEHPMARSIGYRQWATGD